MTQQLRAGVVGAGVFGGHHARKYASLPAVTLTKRVGRPWRRSLGQQPAPT